MNVRNEIKAQINIDAKDTIEDLGYQVLETKKNIVSYIEEIYKKQTEAYRKIIDQRKELIQSAKDEYDYESDVADKVKEIADLQARIDQLSLDDSRSALAERRALEEELAKLQSDLSKTQADHSTDAQLDALDKMADDYEQTVEEDIEKLKQTVNSKSDVWNAFYNTILGNNVSVGDSIDAEIVDAWLRAAQAVQAYGTTVNNLPGMSTGGSTTDDKNTPTSGADPTDRRRIKPGEVYINDPTDRILDPTPGSAKPILKDGNIAPGTDLEKLISDEEYRDYLDKNWAFSMAQFRKMIEDPENKFVGVLDFAINETMRSVPAVSNVVNSIANNNSTNDDNSTVINSQVDVHLSHSGFMSEADMKKYGDQFADIAIGKINESFRRSGIINNRNSRLRPG